MTTWTLGISGGPFDVGTDFPAVPHYDAYWHDAAAVLLRNGDDFVAAHEEERLNRVKHTHAFPRRALASCLDDAGIRGADVASVGIYFTEHHWNCFLTEVAYYEPAANLPAARELLRCRIGSALGCELHPDQLHFIHHHWAHALSAGHASGLDRALVLTIDGGGDDQQSGMVSVLGPDGLTGVDDLDLEQSLGGMYLHVTRHLGYGQFDEYKMMALASAGDPGVYGERLGIVRLGPRGAYSVDWGFHRRLQAICPPRRRDEPFTQVHRDVAATAQAALEDAVLHVLRWYRRTSGRRNLCLAGGVAHNCALNGRLVDEGLFDHVFVHPASHDAGCAMGAALAAAGVNRPVHRRRRLPTAYLGTDVGADLDAALRRWRDAIEVEPLDEPADWIADRVASSDVLGVAYGRAEFGPRALGHRSILADPRVVATRERINRAVKHREPYRPLAPVVLRDAFADIFETGTLTESPFMSFALRVRDPWRERIPAVVHVDATARPQTIGDEDDPFLAAALRAFCDRTGVPVMVNTSLNLNVEPIVDSADDAITFLLTSEVDALYLGGLAVYRAEPASLLHRDWQLSLRDGVLLARGPSAAGNGGWSLRTPGPVRHDQPVTAEGAALLQRVARQPGVTAGTLLNGALAQPDAAQRELRALWRQRLIVVAPTP